MRREARVDGHCYGASLRNWNGLLWSVSSRDGQPRCVMTCRPIDEQGRDLISHTGGDSACFVLVCSASRDRIALAGDDPPQQVRVSRHLLSSGVFIPT